MFYIIRYFTVNACFRLILLPYGKNKWCKGFDCLFICLTDIVRSNSSHTSLSHILSQPPWYKTVLKKLPSKPPKSVLFFTC